MKIKIIIADDHELVRASVAAFLRDEPDFDVVGECSNGRELLDMIETKRPDVAVVDVAMPEMNGVEAARRIKSASPSTRVIVLSNYTDESYVRGALEGGASGYIIKSGAARDLVQAVRNGARGKVYLSEEVKTVAHAISRTGMKGSVVSGRPLSPREREVLQLIAEGNSSKVIGERLGVSETTIKTHRKSIMEKIDVHDTAGLTRYAIRIGLVRAD